jgi:murein DD-endopeptidase MepM/ murein hydrolase activator NlpD
VLPINSEIYFLGSNCIWVAAGNLHSLKTPTRLIAQRFDLAGNAIDGIPVQEFNNFVYYPTNNALVIVDKAGDLFTFAIDSHKWGVFRANAPFLAGEPDPDFIDLANAKEHIVVLDPERNELWIVKAKVRRPDELFKQVLPWRVKPGDIYVGDGIALAYDGDLYVLKRSGYITRFTDIQSGHTARQIATPCRRVSGCRPSRLSTAYGAPLFLVERENNRVIGYDKTTGKASQYLFSRDSDLRGLYPTPEAFWIVNGSFLTYRSVKSADKWKYKLEPKLIDNRLDGIVIPIAGMRLPKHPGVFPGARRLYRYGVHAGVDFFDDPGAKTRIKMGTPARAADAGKIVRADANFVDMNARQFSKVMSECLHAHQTSEHNEDLLRGCQVWIDHGNGLVTRYAHLDRIKPNLKVNQFVKQGDVIGFIGVSGTGQNLPGRAKYPHLHFEIRLDGRYLGYGLTPQETIGIYEDIFGRTQ